MYSGKIIVIDAYTGARTLSQRTDGTADGSEQLERYRRETVPAPPEIFVDAPSGDFISARNRRRLDKRKK